MLQMQNVWLKTIVRSRERAHSQDSYTELTIYQYTSLNKSNLSKLSIDSIRRATQEDS